MMPTDAGRSGVVAAVVYSRDPAKYGLNGDSDITINVADGSSGWGRTYAQSMTRAPVNDDGTASTELQRGVRVVNAHQIALVFGKVYVNIYSDGGSNHRPVESRRRAGESVLGYRLVDSYLMTYENRVGVRHRAGENHRRARAEHSHHSERYEIAAIATPQVDASL